MILMKKITIMLLLSCMLTLVACSKEPEAAKDSHIAHAPNGDLQEMTAGIGTLPAFLDNQSTFIRQAYEVAAEHLDLIEWIPCYCGCSIVAGHSSNKNCFIKEVKSDGSVIWDDHGTRCNVCIEITVIAAKLQAEGKTVQEIRSFIDEAYKTGYAKPTDTKMPI